MKKPTNRQELADATLHIASEAIHALDYAIKQGDLTVRDLNTIATNMSKIHRDLVSDIKAEEKEAILEKEEESEGAEAQRFGATIENLLKGVKEAGG